MTYAVLTSRTVLSITGADAESFLQGLLSCDVRPAFAGSAAVYGTLLTPQGKFLHDMFLYPRAGGVLLDVDAARSPDLLSRLKLYRLRSQVVIEPVALPVVALWNGQTVEGAWQDPRVAALGLRFVGNYEGDGQVPEAAYHRMRLQQAVPDGVQDMQAERSLLLEYGIDRLNGVDFKKGCYVGQEVTARSKFRGQVRKQLHSVCIDGQLPPCGTIVMQGAKEVGQLCSVDGGIGLAFLQLEAVESSQQQDGEPLVAAGVKLDVATPTWMQGN